MIERQALAPSEVELLRAKKLPPRLAAVLRRRARRSWFWFLLWGVLTLPTFLAALSAGPRLDIEKISFALVVSALAWWFGGRPFLRTHQDIANGAVASIEGPLHIHAIPGRQGLKYQLTVADVKVSVPSERFFFDGAGFDANLLVAALNEGAQYVLYYSPAARNFVAIENCYGNGLRSLA